MRPAGVTLVGQLSRTVSPFGRLAMGDDGCRYCDSADGFYRRDAWFDHETKMV